MSELTNNEKRFLSRLLEREPDSFRAGFGQNTMIRCQRCEGSFPDVVRYDDGWLLCRECIKARELLAKGLP